MYRTRFPILTGAVLWLAASAIPATAQSQDAAPAAIEDDAIAALKEMGAYLRTLDGVALTADTTRDEITETGQNVEFASSLDLKARRPDKLRLDVASDRQQRNYYYDGKTVTVFSPVIGAYGVVSAPATIRETLEVAARDYGLELPLADLFLWGTDDDDLGALTDAFVVGPSVVGGQHCDHFAFRQDGIDWQIWIRSDDKPLPCKLVITTTSEESRPRYEATLTWKESTSIADADFTFVPPEDAFEIPVQPAADIAFDANQQ
jgi:hypothetical protein